MFKKLRSFFLLLLILVAKENASAQVFTLDSVFKAIDSGQPKLKMFDARINAYDTYAAGAKALDAPQVGAGFFMTPYNTMMWKPDAATGNPGMGSFMISAQQMIINPRKLSVNSSYMKKMSGVDMEMKNAMKNELHNMAKMNYFEWLVLKKKLRVLTESEALLAYVVGSTEIRYTYGLDKLNGYYKAKAMLGDVQNMKLMAGLEIDQARIELNTLMNRGKDLSFDIDTSYVIKNYEDARVDSSAIAANRSDYKAYSQDIGLLGLRQDYERSKRLPDFGFRYDHMMAFGTQPWQFSLMAMVSIPIVPWSSKMYRSSVSGLNYEIEALKNEQRSLVNQTEGNLHSIQERIKSKKQQLDLYEKTILSAMRKNYQVTLLAYEQNNEELFMVLDAWQNLKTAQLGSIDLLKDLLLLQIEYENELEIK